MSWIECHQSLGHHRKTIKAARLLKVDRHKLIGHLTTLWWWGLDNATETGDLPGIERADLALAAEWKGDPESFAVVLVESGFVDVDPTGLELTLHDWWEYAGKLYDQKELRKSANREAQRRRRSRLHGGDAVMTNGDSVTKGAMTKSDSQHPTVPNLTNQDHTPLTPPSHGDEGVSVSDGAEQALRDQCELFEARVPPQPIGVRDRTPRDRAFTAFRLEYPPNLDGTEWSWYDARKAWQEHVPPGAEAACMGKLALYKASDRVRKGYVRAPANWIPGWRGQAEPTPVMAASAKTASTVPDYTALERERLAGRGAA